MFVCMYVCVYVCVDARMCDDARKGELKFRNQVFETHCVNSHQQGEDRIASWKRIRVILISGSVVASFKTSVRTHSDVPSALWFLSDVFTGHI